MFQRNSTQWTPLDCAAAKGHANVAAVLLEFDSPVDPVDKIKVTVYSIPPYFPGFQNTRSIIIGHNENKWTGVLKSCFPPTTTIIDENCR